MPTVTCQYRATAPGTDPLGCLVLFLTEGQQAPAHAAGPLADAISQAIQLKDFTGKPGQAVTLVPSGSPVQRVLLVGLGKEADLTREKLRRAAGTAGKTVAGMNLADAGLLLPTGLPADRTGPMAEVLAEGALLGAYKFETYKEKPTDEPPQEELATLVLYDPDGASDEAAMQRGVVRGESVGLARTLGNTPANDLTPTLLAEQADQIAKRHGLGIEVLERADMERLGMGMLLGVAKGSHEPPKLIIMEYKAANPRGTLAYVGKGITFDSGGISLKPGAAMDEMKFDMCGAAAVLGAMNAIGSLKPDVNVIAVIPATENLPGGSALKPGDILKSHAGKHVEVLNTDAEGRLVLGDALSYIIDTRKPDGVVDLATLTGACVIALGHYASGAITNNEAFQEQVVAAGRSSGDTVWPLPPFDEYGEALKGKYGDLQNIGGRDAGAITGGLFIKHFVKDAPWVHLDIAGTAWGVKNIGHIPNEGASGVGVALLIDLAANWRPG